MTRQEAEQILIHYDDLVWQQDNHITCGMISEALNLATDALNPWHKVSEELPEERHYKERTLQGIREWSESESVLVIDNHYLKTVDSLKNGEWMKLRTHPRNCDGFPIEYLYWMEIPEIKED